MSDDVGSNRDEFQIRLGQSVRRHIEQKADPIRDPATCAFAYGEPEREQTPVFIAERVMRAIEHQASGNKQREIGGVLLGEFYRADEGSFIEVTDSIEAGAAKSTEQSLTFTHETWEQIAAEQAARGGSARIVGWYHSHPGLGVFMSREDEFIHSSFFTDPWHAAVVVDPIYHNWGCFKWKDGALERASGFYVFGQKNTAKRVRSYAKSLSAARQSAPASASSSAERNTHGSPRLGTLWALIVLMLISQAALTWKVFFDQPNHLKIAREHLAASDLTGSAQELTMAGYTPEAAKEAAGLMKALTNAADGGTDGARLDQINWLVHWAREAHAARPKNSATYIHEVFRTAEATYPRRLARASLAGLVHRELEDERLWRVAYDLELGDKDAKSESEGERNALKKAEKRKVDAIRKQIIDWRQPANPPGARGQ